MKAPSAGSTEGTSSIRDRFRRTLAALAGTAGLALALALFAAPAAPAADWGFEQVTPPNKGAGSVAYFGSFRTSPDGNSFLHTTLSPLDAVPSESAPLYTRYVAHRGPDRWTNVSMDPRYASGTGSGTGFNFWGTIASSANLRYAVVASPIALTPGATEDGGNIYLRDTRTRELTLIATSPNRKLSQEMQTLQGATAVKYVDGEGKAVLFNTNVGLVEGAPLPDPEQPWLPNTQAYKWTPDGGLEIVSVLPESAGGGIVRGGIAGFFTEDATRNSLPREGGAEHVYWTTRLEDGSTGGAYVTSGDEIKPVSHSRLPGEPNVPLPVEMKAISSNGEYAVFITKEETPALTADTPKPPFGEWTPTSFIYRYTFSDGSLDYVGTTHLYGTAGVIQMTQDGQKIAFMSLIAQTEGAENEKPNTYIWNDGELELVVTAELGSSGTGDLTKGRQLFSANTRYYTFTSDSKALAEEFDQDNISSACPVSFTTEPGPCDDVYVYDTEAVGEPLQCASCRAPGVPPAGNAGDPLTENSGQYAMDGRMTQSVANDGTVFFTTVDPLLPADGNKLEDVYAYRDGDLRLVSRATQNNAWFLDATDDGKTVFLATSDPIAPTDTDTAVDVYMTREGAGYPYTPPPVPPVCAGIESCHDGVPPTPAQSSPGSSGFEGRGNEGRGRKAGTGKVTVANPRPAVGSTGTLRVKTPGKGKLTVTGAGVKKASKSVAKAGTYAVKVTLTPAARKALAKAGQVKKKLKVTFKPAQGKASSTTVSLTYKASANTKGGR